MYGLFSPFARCLARTLARGERTLAKDLDAVKEKEL